MIFSDELKEAIEKWPTASKSQARVLICLIKLNIDGVVRVRPTELAKMALTTSVTTHTALKYWIGEGMITKIHIRVYRLMTNPIEDLLKCHILQLETMRAPRMK